MPDVDSRLLVLLSGGFDPVHAGHIRMIEEAARIGDVIIILNCQEWLVNKKGTYFLPTNDRVAIMASITGVVQVHSQRPEDGTSVVGAIARLRLEYPDRLLIFANGGDRTPGEVPEETYCEEHGIPLLYGVGGGKMQSSSDILADYATRLRSVPPSGREERSS